MGYLENLINRVQPTTKESGATEELPKIGEQIYVPQTVDSSGGLATVIGYEHLPKYMKTEEKGVKCEGLITFLVIWSELKHRQAFYKEKFGDAKATLRTDIWKGDVKRMASSDEAMAEIEAEGGKFDHSKVGTLSVNKFGYRNNG